MHEVVIVILAVPFLLALLAALSSLMNQVADISLLAE